jgi:4-hydroxysphinganine ceramide fatty acyl 2-hydroxylase
MFREFWRHGSNAALAALIIVTLALDLTGLAPPHQWLFVLGAVLFFASEYTYHRYAFHAPPMRKIPFILMLQHRLHYDHHLEPARLDLLFLPLWFIVPNFVITGGLAWLVWPHPASVAALLAGTSAAILYYEWVHYVAHIAYRPRSAWGRYIKKYHLWHHFKNERLWFGVTNPSGDFMLGSYAAVDEAAASGTTRTLRR